MLCFLRRLVYDAVIQLMRQTNYIPTYACGPCVDAEDHTRLEADDLTYIGLEPFSVSINALVLYFCHVCGLPGVWVVTIEVYTLALAILQAITPHLFSLSDGDESIYFALSPLLDAIGFVWLISVTHFHTVFRRRRQQHLITQFQASFLVVLVIFIGVVSVLNTVSARSTSVSLLNFAFQDSSAYMFNFAFIFIVTTLMLWSTLALTQYEERTAVAEEQARRQQRFMRWLFHQIRTPLANILLATGEASDALQDTATEERTTSSLLGDTDGPGPPRISTGAQLVSFQRDDVADMQSLLHMSTDACRKASRLLDSVKEFAMLNDATVQQLERSPVDIIALTSTIAESFRGTADERGVRIHWQPFDSYNPKRSTQAGDTQHTPPQSLWVLADWPKLVYAMRAILSNAVQYSANQEGRAHSGHVTVQLVEVSRPRPIVRRLRPWQIAQPDVDTVQIDTMNLSALTRGKARLQRADTDEEHTVALRGIAVAKPHASAATREKQGGGQPSSLGGGVGAQQHPSGVPRTSSAWGDTGSAGVSTSHASFAARSNWARSGLYSESATPDDSSFARQGTSSPVPTAPQAHNQPAIELVTPSSTKSGSRTLRGLHTMDSVDADTPVPPISAQPSMGTRTTESSRGAAYAAHKRLNKRVLRFKVTDNGVGMSDTELAQVVEPFAFLTTSAGTGMSLTMAMAMLQQHSSTLHAASRGLGHGSEFWFDVTLTEIAPPLLATATLAMASHGRPAVSLATESQPVTLATAGGGAAAGPGVSNAAQSIAGRMRRSASADSARPAGSTGAPGSTGGSITHEQHASVLRLGDADACGASVEFRMTEEEGGSDSELGGVRRNTGNADDMQLQSAQSMHTFNAHGTTPGPGLQKHLFSSFTGATAGHDAASTGSRGDPPPREVRIPSIVGGSNAFQAEDSASLQDTPRSGTNALGSMASGGGEPPPPARLESAAVLPSPSMQGGAEATASIPRSNSWSAPPTLLEAVPIPPSCAVPSGSTPHSPTARQQHSDETLAYPTHVRSATEASGAPGSRFNFRDSTAAREGSSAQPWDLVGMDMEDALRSMHPGGNVLAPSTRTPLSSPHVALGMGNFEAASALAHIVSQPIPGSAGLQDEHTGGGQSRSQSVRGLQLYNGAVSRIPERTSEEEDEGSLGAGSARAASPDRWSTAREHDTETRGRLSTGASAAGLLVPGAEQGGHATPLPPSAWNLPRVQLLPSSGEAADPLPSSAVEGGPSGYAAQVPFALAASPPHAPHAGGIGAAAHAHSPSSAHSSASARAAPLVALVVDDVAPTRKLVARVLKRKCNIAETLQAANGKEAVELVADSMRVLPSGRMASSISVITMDMSMPVMDGVQATRAIRELGFAGAIVGLTGNALQADVHSLREAGADRVCTKPVDAEVLRATVLQLISSV